MRELKPDECNILQLSDIHYGDNYNGKFTTESNLVLVLNDARKRLPSGYDIVVLSGDLGTETTSKETYLNIISKCDALLNSRSGVCVLVTPGNHDNRETLTDAYHEYITGKLPVNDDETILCFTKPGSQFAMLSGELTGGRHVIALDTGHGKIPYEGLTRFINCCKKHGYNEDERNNIMFSHMPCDCEGKLYHRFMNDKMLDNKEFMSAVSPHTRNYFCGHLHQEYHFHDMSSGMQIHVAPGVQCQISPFKQECDAVNLPGYSVISWHPYAKSGIDINTFYVEG